MSPYSHLMPYRSTALHTRQALKPFNRLRAVRHLHTRLSVRANVLPRHCAAMAVARLSVI